MDGGVVFRCVLTVFIYYMWILLACVIFFNVFGTLKTVLFVTHQNVL